MWFILRLFLEVLEKQYVNILAKTFKEFLKIRIRNIFALVRIIYHRSECEYFWPEILFSILNMVFSSRAHFNLYLFQFVSLISQLVLLLN